MKYLVDVYGNGYEVIFTEEEKIVNKVIKGCNITFQQGKIVRKPTISEIGCGFVKVTYPNGKTTNDIYAIAKDLSLRERIGDMIAEIRQSKEITQEQLAELSGLSRVNISKIENGRYNVSIDILQKICSVLDCTIDIKAAE